MRRLKLGMCQIEGCNKRALFGLYHTEGVNKTWKYVCAEHESIIGNENLLRARRRLEQKRDY